MSSIHASAREFLDTLSLREVPHSTGDLHGHLLRTGKLLEQWGFHESVCVAGMFHSVLGTSHFSRRSLQLRDLPALEVAIGSRALNLVRIFSVARRPRGLVEALGAGSVELLHGGYAPVDFDTASDLVSIEFANLADQGVCKILVDALRSVPIPRRAVESVPVMQAWGALVLAKGANVAGG